MGNFKAYLFNFFCIFNKRGFPRFFNAQLLVSWVCLFVCPFVYPFPLDTNAICQPKPFLFNFVDIRNVYFESKSVKTTFI